MTRERPIIFSGPMVRAILDGRKTQTRRILKPQPPGGKDNICPYGVAGDRLWVRETWQETPASYRAAMGRTIYAATCLDGHHPPRWRASIHMPRWASRITLEVVGIRAERVQSISEDDAIAEGMAALSPRADYAHLWDEINGKGSWASNPWVWVVEFRRRRRA